MPRSRDRDRRSKPSRGAPLKNRKKKYCQFCADKVSYIDYKDVALLRKFLSERGKIRARRVTGNCSQHQRFVATAVKNAREMALITYSNR
jgi:small subunit ribosomal protein S18